MISLLQNDFTFFFNNYSSHLLCIFCNCFQLLKGFNYIQPSVYFWDFVYRAMPLYLLFCSSSIAVQVIVNNKYFGYLISVVLILVLDIILLLADIGSNMLSFGSTPFLIYSDMNGFGPSEKGVFGSTYIGFLQV